MRIGSIRRTEIRCSLPVLLMLPLCAVFGRLGSFFIAFFSLLLHEAAHAMTAERLGLRVAVIELQPYGCIARLTHAPSSHADAAAIAISGPLVSLLLALTATALRSLIPNFASGLQPFIAFNLSIATVNLFPVLPLDGGRLLCSLLSRRMDGSEAIRLLSYSGCVFGILLILLGVYRLLAAESFAFADIMPVITGFFILLSAARECRSASSERIKQLLAGQNRLHSGGAMPVRAIALSGETSVRAALASLSGGGYNVVLVLTDSLSMLGMLEESRLIDAALSGETELPLKALLVGHGVGS